MKLRQTESDAVTPLQFIICYLTFVQLTTCCASVIGYSKAPLQTQLDSTQLNLTGMAWHGFITRQVKCFSY